MTISLATVLFISLSTHAAPEWEQALDAALNSAGLTTANARFDPEILRFFRQGEFTTPLYESLNNAPWRAPFVMGIHRGELATDKPHELLTVGAKMLGAPTRRALIGNPLAAAEEAAAKPDALANLLNTQSKLSDAARKALGTVPPPVQQAAALILHAMGPSLALRDLAFTSSGVDGVYGSVSGGGLTDAATRSLYAETDLGYLLNGAHDVFMAVAKAEELVRGVDPSTSYEFEVETPNGWVRLCGGSASVHADRPTLLIIDTGGKDRYVNVPSNASGTNGVSVVIDTNEADGYVSDAGVGPEPLAKWSGRTSGGPKPGPGGALGGYCALIDSAGNDRYFSHRSGIGAARFGASILVDRQGDDVYDAYSNGIGFALCGYGAVLDLAGSDVYNGFYEVQGMGQTKGYGALIDRVGNDRYIANDEVIDVPSAQSDKHNVNMSQGAGNGRRGDYIDGHSLAGGVGVLFDGQGDDSYSCGVFGQGLGYWEGVGALFDGGGNDTYLGQWYAQGASAHFAIGYLEDLAGNDAYTAPMNMAQGAGHDFSVGYLLDRGGNDVYKAPNLSLGGGNANGMGLLVDFAGDDRYESSGITLGKASEGTAGSLRMGSITLGIFLDLAGTDTFPAAAGWAKNGVSATNWATQNRQPWESHLGLFFDW